MFSQCCFCKYWLNAPNYTFFIMRDLLKNVRTQRNRQFEFPNDISKKFLLLLLKIMHHHFKSRNTQFPQNSKQIIKKGKGFFSATGLCFDFEQTIKTLKRLIPVCPSQLHHTQCLRQKSLLPEVVLLLWPNVFYFWHFHLS